jgi:hypothetical protein
LCTMGQVGEEGRESMDMRRCVRGQEKRSDGVKEGPARLEDNGRGGTRSLKGRN